MLRYRLINPYSLTVLVLCCALGPGALAADQTLLKIDINGDPNITYPGWTGWLVTGGGGDTGTQSKTFTNGVKIAFSAPWRTTDNGLYCSAWGNTNWGEFSGDTVTVLSTGGSLPPAHTGDMDMTISFLPPGSYTLTTYHSTRTESTYTDNIMDVNDRIGTGAWTRQITHFYQPVTPNNATCLAHPVVLNFSLTQPVDYVARFITSTVDPNNYTHDVGIAGFTLVSHAMYGAYGASPQPESTIRYNTSYTLSWTSDPIEVGDTLTYDVYFSTSRTDLINEAGVMQEPAAKRIATGIATKSTPCPSLAAYTDYYWRVDTWAHQSGSLVKMYGAVWHFDTKNQEPTVDLGPAQVTVQGRTVTLTAKTTDLDNLPAGRVIKYCWIDRTDVNDANNTHAYSGTSPFPIDYSATATSVSFVLDPNDQYTGTGRRYSYVCHVTDGATNNAGVLQQRQASITVTVYNKSMTNCEVNKKLGNYQTEIRSTGDFNDDCIVDIKDLSIYINNWLYCKAVDSICL
jgi:hypothetical protein